MEEGTFSCMPNNSLCPAHSASCCFPWRCRVQTLTSMYVAQDTQPQLVALNNRISEAGGQLAAAMKVAKVSALCRLCTRMVAAMTWARTLIGTAHLRVTNVGMLLWVQAAPPWRCRQGSPIHTPGRIAVTFTCV